MMLATRTGTTHVREACACSCDDMEQHLRVSPLTLSSASSMQDHDQTAGHHSGLQQLLPSELFLNQSISEDRHKESRLCTALQAQKSTYQELPLSTGWAHTAFRELS